MKIDHVAIWVDNIELMRQFYLTYFDIACSEKYTNLKNDFTSYFLSFGASETRIELMNKPNIEENTSKRAFTKGIAHIAISIGGKEAVNKLTERLRADNYTIASEPRTTGDGYYESAILDPEGNYIEISA